MSWRDRIPEVTPEIFYRWGFFLLATNAFSNTITFTYNLFNGMFRFPSILASALASLGFSWLLAGFFYYLKRSIEPSITDDEFIKEFAKEDVNVKW